MTRLSEPAVAVFGGFAGRYKPHGRRPDWRHGSPDPSRPVGMIRSIPKWWALGATDPLLELEAAVMRSLGVKSVTASCDCEHSAIIDVSPLPDLFAVPLVRTRMRCSACGQRPTETRLNWLEYFAPGSRRPLPSMG